MALVCVKIGAKSVYIEMTQASAAGTGNDENPGLTCEDAPLDTFSAALQAFSHRAHQLNELADEDARYLTVRAVRVYRKKSGKTFEVEYERSLRRVESGGRAIPEKTLRYEPTERDNALLTDLAAQAQLYLAGERLQVSLGLVDGGEEGDGEEDGELEVDKLAETAEMANA